jgi:flagellar motor switch protein FliN
VNPWLSAELVAHIQSAFETATGERPDVDCGKFPPPDDCTFRWRQSFAGIPGALWIVASDTSQMSVVQQAVAEMAQAFAGLLDREVRTGQAGERPTIPLGVHWAQFDLAVGDTPVTFFAGAEADLLSAISRDEAPPETSKTFDLLLDVELPVSVSFGRAQVPLKDVLKLTTGSIIELNRAIGDPVELIVNNCVIARGEVVTVAGNFGVRIQQVISRGERLRTLK